MLGTKYFLPNLLIGYGIPESYTEPSSMSMTNEAEIHTKEVLIKNSLAMAFSRQDI